MGKSYMAKKKENKKKEKEKKKLKAISKDNKVVDSLIAQIKRY